MVSNEKEEISMNKRKDILLKKYKKLLISHYETANFKEPIAIFLRRDGTAEFHENVTQGKFEYESEDGDKEKRYIIINPKKQYTFPYGNKTFRGYILHEDHPFPLPDDPIMDTEMLNITIEKTLNDIKKWKAEELNARGDMYLKIGMAIAIILAVIILYKIMVPGTPAPAPAGIISAAQNITTIIENGTRTVIYS